MVHPAQGTAQTAAVTYGALFGDAVTALTDAREHAVGPFETATSAGDTAADYERFLAVTGRHLELLLAHTPAVSTRDRAIPRRLAGELAALPPGSPWRQRLGPGRRRPRPGPRPARHPCRPAR